MIWKKFWSIFNTSVSWNSVSWFGWYFCIKELKIWFKMRILLGMRFYMSRIMWTVLKYKISKVCFSFPYWIPIYFREEKTRIRLHISDSGSTKPGLKCIHFVIDYRFADDNWLHPSANNALNGALLMRFYV